MVNNVNDQDIDFYSRLFNNYEYIPFEFPPGNENFVVNRKLFPGDPELYL